MVNAFWFSAPDVQFVRQSLWRFDGNLYGMRKVSFSQMTAQSGFYHFHLQKWMFHRHGSYWNDRAHNKFFKLYWHSASIYLELDKTILTINSYLRCRSVSKYINLPCQNQNLWHHIIIYNYTVQREIFEWCKFSYISYTHSVYENKNCENLNVRNFKSQCDLWSPSIVDVLTMSLYSKGFEEWTTQPRFWHQLALPW